MNRCVVWIAIVCTWISHSFADAGRPNVVVILTDNHGAWTLGCYGNPDVRTPNIDRLADEGTLFTRAFASNPVCSPTRATLLTGLVPSQHGVHSFLAGGNLQTGPNARCTLDQFTSMPEVLRDAGYACGLVGKWHLGGNMTPQEGLDDYWITMPHGATSTFYGAQVIQNGKLRTEPNYLTDFWTEHAIRFIDQQAKSNDQPFFLYLAYNGPYSLSRLLLREGRNRHAAFYADKEIASFPRTKAHPWQLNNLDYINNATSIRRVATEVSGVDDGVGQVMQALERNGIDDNTIVIFLADQGWVGGQGGFFGMGDHTRPLTARDGMMQIPMIWRHPSKITAGQRSDQMIANYDVLPTLLGHLGLGDRMPAKPKSPGGDFSSLLTGQGHPFPKRDAIFFEFENMRGVRTTAHKYVHRHPNGPHELYDLASDPDEFINLVDHPGNEKLRDRLKSQLTDFYDAHSLARYDMWNGGTSQVRIHDGIDEHLAQLPKVQPPALPAGFEPASIDVPIGFSVDLIAGPPMVTHPTMACFDDSGNLYVCNNSGVNLSNEDLEQQLPNAIHRLVDADDDGVFDSFTVFADEMTFPMGGVWHEGSLFVASPPEIWKLTDTDGDGVADDRKAIVGQFGYNGNAASIHGCFLGPDGRLYWTDGYHGHEFKNEAGDVVSKREGSYLFSCRTDGTDRQIHCGGGMDNPVEIDFTESGDMLGTVNILYTRPRVDAMVHWLRGGAYPHRERVLDELHVTGDLLGPVHRFGHVAVSGVTRYRSGVMDHRWGDDWFATFFNSGKVVRMNIAKDHATYAVTQHEFLSSTSRDFHPTDVLEDADGSLLVIDTGGWFYRGCPTSQLAKPDVMGGIYRIRRDGMTPLVDPRGKQVDWPAVSPAELVRTLNDTRFAVRRRAIDECAKRGGECLPLLQNVVKSGDVRVRLGRTWALSRLVSEPATSIAAATALRPAMQDFRPEIRQAAAMGLAHSNAPVDYQWLTPLLRDDDASVRRQAATTLGMIGDPGAAPELIESLQRDNIDRSEEHSLINALIDIAADSPLELDSSVPGLAIAMLQSDPESLTFDEVATGLQSSHAATRPVALRLAKKHPQWIPEIHRLVRGWIHENQAERFESAQTLVAAFIRDDRFAAMAGEWLANRKVTSLPPLAMQAIRDAGNVTPHESWIAPLAERLESPKNDVVGDAIATVSSFTGGRFDPLLRKIFEDSRHPIALRMDAVAALAASAGRLEDELFRQLVSLYQSGSPTASSRAAQIIGQSKQTRDQLTQTVELIGNASPLDLRAFMTGFSGPVDADLAGQFLTSIASSENLRSLSESEFSDVVKRFPPQTLPQANEILDRLKQYHQQKIIRLESLRDQLADGDSARGRTVFFGQKANCSSCHRIGDEGKRVGPDLTTIGANRSSSDLLESIVFPSASIVRDYATHQVLTVDGRAMTGIVVAENSQTVDLQLANGEKSTLNLDDIESITPSSQSIMPAGLDEALSNQDLLDVVVFLQGCKEERKP